MTIVHITYHDETNIGSCPIGQTGGFENADGNGEIHCFRIFDGVSVMLMQLEMGSYTEIRTQVGVLEVNFCINGRFETSFSMRSHVLLKPGDMAISCYDGLHGTKSESHFPLGYYEGLCLEIDPAAAGHWIRLNAPAFPIDFTALKQNLLGSKWYMVGPAGPRCEHVFRELYESASYAERGFLQLKVLELMLLLGRIPQERAADPYCSAEQTTLAHHLRDHLLTNREGYVSLAQLAAEHAISVSHLQKLFKQTSQRTSREATPTKPRQLSTPDSCRERGETALRGRKVARPPPVRFKNPMAALASDSVSTTICCMAAPRAISMAVVNRSSV